MWISIRTNRISISPRMRASAEAFVQRALNRERRQLASVLLRLAPAKLGGADGFSCQLTIWSHYLGLISVGGLADTVRTAVQQATLRSRQVVRRRLHKRRERLRRLGKSRLDRWPSMLNE